MLDTRLDKLTVATRAILNGEITPEAIYKIVLLGDQVYRQGRGLSHVQVERAIALAFEKDQTVPEPQNGQMTRRLTAMSFAIDMSVADFSIIMERDRDGDYENTLTKRLSPMVRDIEYDHHFGPSVFYTIIEQDGYALINQRVMSIVKDYIAGK